MKRDLLEILRCPETGLTLELNVVEEIDGDVVSGELVTRDGSRRYAIDKSVPRFVPMDNYAKGFGFQWNKFRETQLDSHTGVPLSRDRLFESSGWTPEMLKGKRVLDVGCGAGRFTEAALATGARVVSLDYSSAVDACWVSHGHCPNLNVVQGDIYQLPFEPGSFDYVYCLGVLQHTPDVRRSFMSLPPQVRPGGALVVDTYAALAMNVLWPKYWLRPFTKRLPQETLFRLVQGMVAVLLPISVAIGRIPVVGRRLRYAVPVCNYDGVFPLTKQQLQEWSVLDTFDMYAPAYDQPQTLETLRAWFAEAGMCDIQTFRRGTNVARGRKPVS